MGREKKYEKRGDLFVFESARIIATSVFWETLCGGKPQGIRAGAQAVFSDARRGCGKDGMWTYLVWGEKAHALAHELAHVVLHVFERCGIDPREGNGEPFCYMLSTLFVEANGSGLAENKKQ
jgi:hypothetical protein